MDPRQEVAARIADEVAASGISLVASLPDNWISELIRVIDGDDRFKADRKWYWSGWCLPAR